MPPMRRVACVAIALWALQVRGADAFDWSGFALLRGATATERVPLDDDRVNAQLQLGLDWRPSPRFGAHVHLLARNDDDHSKRGRAGVVQAFLDQTFERDAHRVRLTEGAFFLPTSRENVDALWETAYSLTPSALNTWMGEEFRPIGVDAAYTFNRTWTAGVTLFSGNDTFGALPAVRGWMLHDHWTLLGEHVPVDAEYFTSVSAENDRRYGWSARGRWNNDRALVQLTHIDNRSDALEHEHELFDWATRFDIAAAELTSGDWTFASEAGWGETIIIVEGMAFTTDIRAAYALASRRFPFGRATVRVDSFEAAAVQKETALTAAFFWTPRGHARIGAEAIVAGDDRRLALEVRYTF
jgi:hypothetical protein